MWATGRLLRLARYSMDGSRTLRRIVAELMEIICKGGMDVLDPGRTGNLARCRPLEFTAIMNRVCCLKAASGETLTMRTP